MVLKQRIEEPEEETEVVQEILRNQVTLAGFYSYGKIALLYTRRRLRVA
ncbi:MAG: hypothetical protein L3K24_10820 [Gammaproteobacteria bacterium]|nr:hypothetical protein [Gammaproteobacteria bacterium]